MLRSIIQKAFFGIRHLKLLIYVESPALITTADLKKNVWIQVAYGNEDEGGWDLEEPLKGPSGG